MVLYGTVLELDVGSSGNGSNVGCGLMVGGGWALGQGPIRRTVGVMRVLEWWGVGIRFESYF